MTPFIPPPGYARIKLVQSFDELITTRFAGGVNALCWQRTLPGDFSEIVQHLADDDGMTTLDELRLRSLPLSAAGKAAVEFLLADQQLLQNQGLSPILDCIHAYPRDEDAEGLATDVYSFHADSATTQADTWLCTYHGPSSEGLRNDEAQRHIDIPETRAKLLELFGGDDDDGFAEYLHECCYDLHYASTSGAQPFSFGLGNLWRIAVEYPGCAVPPCIHRAPATVPGQPPRLLLIS